MASSEVGAPRGSQTQPVHVENDGNALELAPFPADYYKQYRCHLNLVYQARLRAYWDASLLHLARGIVKADESLSKVWEGYKIGSSLQSFSVIGIHNLNDDQKQTKAMHEVVKCLLAISMTEGANMLHAMLQRRLGQYIYNKGPLPGALSSVYTNPSKKSWRPVIYGNFHCNEKGVAPSARRYEKVLRAMELYIGDDTVDDNEEEGDRDYEYEEEEDDEHDEEDEDISMEDCDENDDDIGNENGDDEGHGNDTENGDDDSDDKFLTSKNLDQLVEAIDFASSSNSGLPRHRDWAAKINNKIHFKNWRRKRNGRRYAHNQNMKAGIRLFINAFRKQLALIPEADKDKPLPWHLTYIGWTARFLARKEEHYRHAPSAELKNLVEATTHALFPKDGYFMRMHPLINVTSPIGIRAEHVVSILVGSYTVVGGLNAVSGSTKGHITTASKKQYDICWLLAKKAMNEQGVYKRNADALLKQLKKDKPYIDLEAVRSELIEKERELIAVRRLAREKVHNTAREFLRWLKACSAMKNAEENVIPQIEENLDWLEQANALIAQF